MALNKTLSELITDTRRRADMLGSDFVSDAEITSYINKGIYRLTSKLIKFHGAKRFRKEALISVVADTASYALPSDHFQTEYLRVNLQGYRWDIPRNTTNNVDMHTSGSGHTWSEDGVSYSIWGDNIRFDPTPTTTYSVTHVYLANLPVTDASGTPKSEMDTSTDLFNSEWGWDEWVTLFAAKKCLEKEESDVGGINAELLQIEQEIEAIAKDKSIGSAPKTKEVYVPTRRRNRYRSGY